MTPDLAPIYRAPMRARTVEAPPGAGADFGVEHGVVGIGERVDPAPATLEEAVRALVAAHGEKAGRMLAHFAALPEGTFAWTQQAGGSYRLGAISGPWRYEDSAAARAVGIHHVRPTAWSPRRFGVLEVPAAVGRTFARGGRNFQRTHDPEAERLTGDYWEQTLRALRTG
jgi:hypothetical protein